MTHLPDAPLPPTRQEPVTEVLHGRTNIDPYRWLEDEASPEVQAWVAAQNAYTAAQLSRVPTREELRQRMATMLAIGSVQAPRRRAGRYFYTRHEGTHNQPRLYLREGPDGAERVVLDPNTASATGIVALDWWYPSEDGRRLAYGYSSQGDEKSTLYVLDVDSGQRLPDTIPHTRYSSLAWEHDGQGFYYTRNPAPGTVPPGEEEYHIQVFHHRLGDDPAADPEIFGAGRDMTESHEVQISPDGRWLVIFSNRGWIHSEVHVRDLHAPAAPLVPIITGREGRFAGEVLADTLYVRTNWQAPHEQVLAIDLTNPAPTAWREVIPERADVVIQGLLIAGGRLILNEEQHVVSRLGVYSTDGTPQAAPALPPLGSLTGVEGESADEEIFFSFESYTVPPTVYRYHLGRGELSTWATVPVPLALDTLQVEQVWYPSKDGTRVPLFIIGPRGWARDGNNPTVLNGYGGFNISRTPAFSRPILPWIERGGLYAVANLRGGSEYGEAWHEAGMLGNKQNVFDDFAAAAEYLIAQGYTRRERLGISGRSNGGLLVGATLVQRPELFGAVVCTVPLLDMLRYQHFRIAKLWIPEYGSADDPAQIDWLWAYSPYHHVVPGTDYPAVLFTTAESDSRVDPLHARKMAALLQSTHPRRPVLLWVETAAGHGIGKPLTKQIVEQTDIWTFLAWQLGLGPVAPG
ncbi:MAG TPA: prolyl oligopeptidase family serine peptidase [Chloroflexia bacterium]|nr:prolyl oligopeptidase family serine peptidase [Chloroflexia bacterium]